MNKGLNEPEIADADFSQRRNTPQTPDEIARIESLDTTWNPDKSPEAMKVYEQSLIAAGGEYAELAMRRQRIAELMAQGVDFETARTQAK